VKEKKGTAITLMPYEGGAKHTRSPRGAEENLRRQENEPFHPKPVAVRKGT